MTRRSPAADLGLVASRSGQIADTSPRSARDRGSTRCGRSRSPAWCSGTGWSPRSCSARTARCARRARSTPCPCCARRAGCSRRSACSSWGRLRRHRGPRPPRRRPRRRPPPQPRATVDRRGASAGRQRTGRGGGIVARLRTLAAPLVALLGSLAVALTVAVFAGVPGPTLKTVATLVVSPLWFLLPYLVLCAAAPLHRPRSGRCPLVVGGVAVVGGRRPRPRLRPADAVRGLAGPVRARGRPRPRPPALPRGRRGAARGRRAGGRRADRVRRLPGRRGRRARRRPLQPQPAVAGLRGARGGADRRRRAGAAVAAAGAPRAGPSRRSTGSRCRSTCGTRSGWSPSPWRCCGSPTGGRCRACTRRRTAAWLAVRVMWVGVSAIAAARPRARGCTIFDGPSSRLDPRR